MAEEKIYVGSGKEKFDGDLVEIALCLSKIPDEWKFEYKGEQYVKIKSCKKKELDEFGKSHYVCIDTFKPAQKEENE